MPSAAVQVNSKGDERVHSFDHSRDTPGNKLEVVEPQPNSVDTNGTAPAQMSPNPAPSLASITPAELTAGPMAGNGSSEASMVMETQTPDEEETAAESERPLQAGPFASLPGAPPEDEEQRQTSGNAESTPDQLPRSASASQNQMTVSAEEGTEMTLGNTVQSEPEPGAGEPGDAEQAVAHPQSPEEDPDFVAAVTQVGSRAAGQQAHRPVQTEVHSAQSAAPSPDNETESIAQAQQVEEMDQQEAGTFNAEAFKELLLNRIAAILPTNEEEADAFSDDNRMDEVQEAASGQTQVERDGAVGAIESSTQAQPDIGSVTSREPSPLDEPEAGSSPHEIAASRAMPDPRRDSEVSRPLQENMAEVDQQMSEAEVTETQLANSNEARFTQALDKKKEAKRNTEQAPIRFRQQEDNVLTSSRTQARTVSEEQLEGMHGDRGELLGEVAGQQQDLMTRDTAERQAIADRINDIYENTKTDVEGILSSLDEEVSGRFERGAERAKRQFEDYVDRKMDAYKKERYGEWFDVSGWGARVGDAFTGLPDEVNAFFVRGRERYINDMDVVLTGIADYVAEKLNEATRRITEGKQEVQDYVTSLPENLQEAGQEAAEEIQGQFDELQQSVNSKQDELVDSLAQQYKESLDAVDARIEEMQAANRGLIDAALGAIAGVIETIIQIKNMLVNMLSGAVEAIKAIIADPIGFLGNLIQGVKQGLANFMSRIVEHLQSGLIGWLTGALGPVGIQIPDDLFSLKGIFSLVMQVLGLTWDYVREKAVQLFGEPVVQAMETGLEIFQILRSEGVAGLWEYVKEQFADLKETVIDTIKEMVITQVVQAGIKWVMGLLNPAGAFVKAAMLIIDIVKFFIERGSQIIELVNSISESIRAIASGNVGQVAAKVEDALKRAVPVLIGFLASLLGISGLAQKVQNLIKKIRKRIDKAITKVLMKAKKMAGKLLAKLGISKDKNKPDSRTPQEKQKDLDDATKEANQYLDEDDANPEDVREKLPGLKTKYDLVKADLKQNPGNEKYYIEVEINPKKQSVKRELEDKRPEKLVGKKTPRLDELQERETGASFRYVDNFLKVYKGSRYKVPDDIVDYVEHRAARKLGIVKESGSILSYSAASKISGLTKRSVEVFDNRDLAGESRMRVPDIYKEGAVVGDVKDVKYQSFDAQMRDNVEITLGHARYPGKDQPIPPVHRFDLVVRDSKDGNEEGTKISKPLKDAIDESGGEIYELI